MQISWQQISWHKINKRRQLAIKIEITELVGGILYSKYYENYIVNFIKWAGGILSVYQLATNYIVEQLHYNILQTWVIQISIS